MVGKGTETEQEKTIFREVDLSNQREGTTYTRVATRVENLFSLRTVLEYISIFDGRTLVSNREHASKFHDKFYGIEAYEIRIVLLNL